MTAMEKKKTNIIVHVEQQQHFLLHHVARFISGFVSSFVSRRDWVGVMLSGVCMERERGAITTRGVMINNFSNYCQSISKIIFPSCRQNINFIKTFVK